MPPPAPLDCLIVGGGPAGLTAALYLARFRRRALVIDAGDPRAAWIPTSHNIPFFAEGIGGPDLLSRARDHAIRYGAQILGGTVEHLAQNDGHFTATLADGRTIEATKILLATGAEDIEPDLPDLRDAIRRGLVRYCPICDGYEAQGKRIAVIGHGDRGLGEAVFIARTYPSDVTLLTLGGGLELDAGQRERVAEHGIRVVHDPIAALDIKGDRIAALRSHGGELRFDVLYSALGLQPRTGLAASLGADRDDEGRLLVDDHNQTSIPGLYAAGGIVRGLDQIVVAMGHAAVAATHIHNRCQLPTEQEPETNRQGP